MTESHLSQEIDPDAGVTEGSATSIETENGHLENGAAASAEVAAEPVVVAEPEAAELDAAEPEAAEPEAAELDAATPEAPELETPELETPELETAELESADLETPEQDAAPEPAEPEAAAPAPSPTDVPAHAPTDVSEHVEEPYVETPPPPVPEACADPSRWGRVDTDGTVYVRTADGERAIGSWHAGDVDKALAHYALRFDDIRTEVELLEARLLAGSGEPKHTMSSAKQVKESLADAAVVGDLVALEARLDHLMGRAKQAIEAVKEARDRARADAIARKQDLVAEAEKIAEESTQWKSAGDRLRSILDEWKTVKGVDRKTDDTLWKRFSKARDTFNRRRGSHFADLDRQRATAKERKQELVTEAEELAESDDWGPTASRYKELMTEWKAAGRAPKDADDALWQAFRAAQDKFFSRRSAVFNERDAELTDNARRKEELLLEAEKINPSADLDGARAHLHRIQERWETIGKVPRERIRELEGRLRAIEDRVRSAADAQWRRTDPEAEARAAQFRERVEQFEAQAAKARAAGDNRRAEQAEAQAAQWREWLAAAENAVASR
jgi:hypothetical protein